MTLGDSRGYFYGGKYAIIGVRKPEIDKKRGQSMKKILIVLGGGRPKIKEADLL